MQCCCSTTIYVIFPHHLDYVFIGRSRILCTGWRWRYSVGARSCFRWKLHPSSQAWPLLSTSNRGETAIAKCGNLATLSHAFHCQITQIQAFSQETWRAWDMNLQHVLSQWLWYHKVVFILYITQLTCIRTTLSQWDSLLFGKWVVGMNDDIKNNAWVTVNNDFLVTSGVFCQWFSRVMKSRVKIIDKTPHEWPKIVIHGNECIILFLTRYFISWTYRSATNNHRSPISPLSPGTIFSDLTLWHHHSWSVTSREREALALWRNIHRLF